MKNPQQDQSAISFFDRFSGRNIFCKSEISFPLPAGIRQNVPAWQVLISGSTMVGVSGCCKGDEADRIT